MKYFVIASVLLACSTLALGAAIDSSRLQEFHGAGDPQLHTLQLSRQKRQLSLSGALSNAIGNGVGLIPGVGSLLSGPVTSLLQGPLSSSFNFLTNGLVTRGGPYSEPQQYWSPLNQPWSLYQQQY